MTTTIRPELAESNKYRINKHRYYELKHYCLQYPVWKKNYAMFDNTGLPLSIVGKGPTSNTPGDPTGERAVIKAYYNRKIKMLEDIAMRTDPYLCEYILKAVTQELSYNYLRTRLEMPCGRDMYYDRYHKFFWLLNKERD